MKNTWHRRAAVVAALVLALGTTAGLADEVTLKSDDGTITISGELIRFENGVYTIRSNLGNIGVPASRVTCSGPACPDLATDTATAADTPAVPPVAEPVAVAPTEVPAPVAEAPVAEAPAEMPAAAAEPVVAPEVAELAPTAEPVPAPAEAAPAEPVYESYDPATIDFSIKGSDTVGDELMPLLIKGAAESLGAVIQRTEVGERQSVHVALGAEGAGDALFSIFLEDKGSSTSFKGLLDGSAQVGISSRAVKPEETEAFIAAGLGDPSSFEQEHAIAIDGLLIIVHPSNPVPGLTFDQVSRLLAGEITNWAEVGGPDLPVTVHTRNTESGTYATIVDTFLKPYDREMSPNANVVTGNAQLTEAVFNDPTGIGYVGFAYQRDSRPVDIVADCGIASVPNSFGAKTGEYPLQRTLYIYTGPPEDLPPLATALVDYSISDAATPFVEKSGFIAYSIETADMARQAALVAETLAVTTSPSEQALMTDLLAEMDDWQRLSSTFRFKTGSAVLENVSRRNLERLAAFMTSEGAGREFALVGFTDSDGAVEANRKLALARAQSMRDELQKIMDPADFETLKIDVKGYGEINPVGCNTDFAGQRLNRRVEVWMR